MKIHPKVKWGSFATTGTLVVVTVADLFGVKVPPELASGLTAILGLVAGYMAPSPPAA